MEGLKLYEISQEMTNVLDMLLDENGEDIDITIYKEAMDLLKTELKNKSSSILKYIQNLKAQNVSAKEEYERLQKLYKARENKILRLKNYVISILQELESKKIVTDLGSYGLRRSSSVDVYDMSSLPKEFLRVTEEIKVNKEKIKEYIKSHGEIPGARMLESYSLQIR